MTMSIVLMAVQLSTHAQTQQFTQGPYGPGQQYPAGQDQFTLPGIGAMPGLSQGDNEVYLSVSIASEEQGRVYFLVNSFAISSPGSGTATLYRMNAALPGIIDRPENSIQVDLSKLSSSVQSTQQVPVDQLYSAMRYDTNSIMIRLSGVTPYTEQGQASFRISSMSVITPDGAMSTFNLGQPIVAVFDSSTMRIYTVGFNELYTLLDRVIVNIRNNYYTTVVTSIYQTVVVTVTPPVIYPVMTPLIIPVPFPVVFPVPFPIPYPTFRPTVTPTISPTVTPTISPTGMPTFTPTVMPTVTPTISPTGMPTFTPTVQPTFGPTVTARPTLRPTWPPGRPTIFPGPTLAPTVGPIQPSPRPTDGVFPTFRPPFDGIGRPTIAPPISPPLASPPPFRDGIPPGPRRPIASPAFPGGRQPGFPDGGIPGGIPGRAPGGQLPGGQFPGSQFPGGIGGGFPGAGGAGFGSGLTGGFAGR